MLETSAALTLPALLGRAAQRWPNKLAIRCELDQRSVSFSALDEWTDALACKLAGRGIGPGDVVAVMLPNSIEFPALWLALAKAGATMTPINLSYRDKDRSHLLAHSGAKAFIGRAHDIAAVQSDPVCADQLFWCATPAQLDADPLEGASVRLPHVRAFDIANIQYTSGTTGLPKGCVLSHAYWTRFGQCFLEHGPRLTEDDNILTAQAFSYADPQWNVAAALASGASLTILEKFSPSHFWQAVCAADATFFYCLGAMPNLLLKMAPTPYEQRHRVRMVVCSAIPRDRHKDLEQRFGMPWLEAFGTTETGGDLIVDLDEHDQTLGSGAIGRAITGKEARILNAAGNQALVGEVGELAIRGVGMMERYHDDMAATEAAFRGGHYRTGDLAWQDERGLIYYAGRTKDMIRRGGENIAAAEVEAVLQEHPGVALAACIPVHDELFGEEVKAFLVLTPNDEGMVPSMTALRDFVGARLARFKVPRYWEQVIQLPMTPSQRVAKAELIGAESSPPRGEDLGLRR